MQELNIENKKAVLVFTDFKNGFKKDNFSDKILDSNASSVMKTIEEDELESLAKNIYIEPVYKIRFNVLSFNPSTFIGSGQAERIRLIANEADAEVVIFNHDLSPRIQRNLEALLNLCVIDRSEVIIQIFADRARTTEAALQAQLAHLEYSMPRLTRKWVSLSQQRGGVKGSRGSGEKKLELDKRRLRKEITKLKKEVEKVKLHREVQRKSRITAAKKIGAIVGYTNAGKSSLLKKLSGTDIFAENKLFATLDAETRKIFFQSETGGVSMLLTDTVGFINNLPHQLIDSFRSTLEEVVIADFLIIVCDASHPAMAQCFSVTNLVLNQLGCGDKPTMIVINKTDSVFSQTDFIAFKTQYPESIEISVKTGFGLENLKLKLANLNFEKSGTY